MKFTINILFCFILILQYNSVNGDLKNFFQHVHGSVQESASKIRQDVKSLFNKSEKPNQVNDTSNTNIVFQEDTNEPADTPQHSKPKEVTPVPTTTQPSVPGTDSKNGTTTTDNKDGRENFSGGCLSGYMRTADGRCKPTFG